MWQHCTGICRANNSYLTGSHWDVLFFQVFRNIIVPLAGQKKALMLSDARKVRKQIEKTLPSRSLPEVYAAIAQIFQEAKEAADKPKTQ
jgi:hypothetical protein